MDLSASRHLASKISGTLHHFGLENRNLSPFCGFLDLGLIAEYLIATKADDAVDLVMIMEYLTAIPQPPLFPLISVLEYETCAINPGDGFRLLSEVI